MYTKEGTTFDELDANGDGVISREEFDKIKKELDALKKKHKKKKSN